MRGFLVDIEAKTSDQAGIRMQVRGAELVVRTRAFVSTPVSKSAALSVTVENPTALGPIGNWLICVPGGDPGLRPVRSENWRVGGAGKLMKRCSCWRSFNVAQCPAWLSSWVLRVKRSDLFHAHPKMGDKSCPRFEATLLETNVND